jgi:hypothetical protein
MMHKTMKAEAFRGDAGRHVLAEGTPIQRQLSIRSFIAAYVSTVELDCMRLANPTYHFACGIC